MDHIAEFLVNIKNARESAKDKLDIPASGLRRAIAEVMKAKKWIRDYRLADDGRQGLMRIYLEKHHMFKGGFKRISKPGRRIYVGYKDIPLVRSGKGFAIISTNRGILSDQEARSQKVGGEFLCELW